MFNLSKLEIVRITKHQDYITIYNLYKQRNTLHEIWFIEDENAYCQYMQESLLYVVIYHGTIMAVVWLDDFYYRSCELNFSVFWSTCLDTISCHVCNYVINLRDIGGAFLFNYVYGVIEANNKISLRNVKRTPFRLLGHFCNYYNTNSNIYLYVLTRGGING